jgi:hypothetical protein
MHLYSRLLFSLDLDLPLECDDEFWEDGFQQPPGKPSSIAFFNCYLRLLDIHAYAMRSIVRLLLSLMSLAAHPFH